MGIILRASAGAGILIAVTDTAIGAAAAKNLAAVQIASDRGLLRRRGRAEALPSLEGRIAAGLGRTEEALQILEEVRNEHQARRQLFETAGLGLELVSLLTALGRSDRVAELAQQLEPLAQEKRLPDATRSTLRLFGKAVKRESFDAEIARRFASDYWKTSSRLTRPYELPVSQ